MKVAVRYYTKTGNTKRLAESIGNAVGAEALPISTPITERRFGISSRDSTRIWSARLSTLARLPC